METKKINLSFEQALSHLKKDRMVSRGHKIGRKGWNGKSMHVALQMPDATSKMRLPYLYMQTATGELIPWLASHSDLLSDDWMIIK